MSESVIDVVEVSDEPAGALDCFRSESHSRVQARPRPAPRLAAVRRPKRQRHRPRRFDGAIYASVFAGGLLIGSLLTRPAFPTTTAIGSVRPAGVVPKAPVVATNAADVRNEEGTAGSAPGPVAVDNASLHTADAVGTDASPRPAEHSRAQGYQGTLVVTSRPRGANVFLNGTWQGETPLVLRGQAVGSRALRLVLDGYTSWSSGVQVVADRSTTIAATLRREE